MSTRDFEVVFEKLADLDKQDSNMSQLVEQTKELAPECQEIAELRRLVLDLVDSEPASYTTT